MARDTDCYHLAAVESFRLYSEIIICQPTCVRRAFKFQMGSLAKPVSKFLISERLFSGGIKS